jgi:hypothetical protein
MFQISRAMYRELSAEIVEPASGAVCTLNHQRVLAACESAIERMVNDRHYFARPTRTLFNDIRHCFPMSSQERVYRVVERYMAFADAWVAQLPRQGCDANGNALQCRATTRKGTACQRMPLPHNGYCPSHQHLAETEERELQPPLAA